MRYVDIHDSFFFFFFVATYVNRADYLYLPAIARQQVSSFCEFARAFGNCHKVWIKKNPMHRLLLPLLIVLCSPCIQGKQFYSTTNIKINMCLWLGGKIQHSQKSDKNLVSKKNDNI